MNYYRASQRSDGSGWAMTVTNDGQTWTVGSCVDGEGDDRTPHTHPTQDAAERCFYEAEINGARVWRATSAHKCAVGGEWTDRIVDTRLLGMAHLCEEHDSPEARRSAIPFHSDIRISASW